MTAKFLAGALATGLLLTFSVSCSLLGKHGEKEADSRVQAGAGSMLLYNAEQVNSEAAQKAPYVILVSIDGYRYDYNRLFQPPNLTRLASEGVAAESLRPAYPSKTFPSHYTLVTGLRPEHHGIVSNEFYDPARDQIYSLPDRQAVEDGSWYFGEPLWTTAGREGMLSASFFWVGSESDIQGTHPNYYYRYDAKVPYEERVDQVLAWLNLPPEKRPHLITLYFEPVDMAAHKFGIQSKEEREAVLKIDAMIGRLREGVAKTKLPVNLVVVSDHGMQDVDAKKVINLDERPEAARILAKFQEVGRGPQMLLYLNKGEDRSLIDEAAKILRKGASNYRVYRRDELEKLGYSSTPRVGDLMVEPDAPYLIGLRAHAPQKTGANHGWDPKKNKSMHGIFFAVGPSFKEPAKVPTFDNVDVYPLLLDILGLKQRVPVDGSDVKLLGILRHNVEL